MFGILENTTVKLSSKSEQKKIRPKFFWEKFVSAPPDTPRPLYPRFRRGLCPLHPLQGLLHPEPGWKTIDWNSNQLVLMYYWSTLLNQVQFRNFRHIFDPICKQISQASFFHDYNHCPNFYPLYEDKEFCSEMSKKFPFFEAYSQYV